MGVIAQLAGMVRLIARAGTAFPCGSYGGEWYSNCTIARVKIKIGFGLLGTIAVYVLAAAQTPPPPKQPEERHLISSLEGYDLYQAYCAVCHGKTGKGDGPMAGSLKVSPPDLTHIAMRSGGRFPRQRVEQILSGEAAAAKGHGTREMPLWGPIFSQIAWDQDLGRVRIDNVAKYLEQIQAK
jgi:mono/diheme cytochrome c family protein